jgi:hypothetical protein
MGLGGINVRHHKAGERPPRLVSAEQRADAEAWLAQVRRIGGGQKYGSFMPRVAVAEDLPDEFILVPLQDDQDTNMEFAPPAVKTTLALVRWVTEQDIPYPVVFKLHPAKRADQKSLSHQPLRSQDSIREGPIHGYLKHPSCLAVVTVNSNSANDSLVWGVPVVTLGRGIWQEDGPFFSSLPDNWAHFLLRARAEKAEIRLDYVAWLRSIQWTDTELGDLKFFNFVHEVMSK